jgi:hypothetical protein
VVAPNSDAARAEPRSVGLAAIASPIGVPPSPRTSRPGPSETPPSSDAFYLATAIELLGHGQASAEHDRYITGIAVIYRALSLNPLLCQEDALGLVYERAVLCSNPVGRTLTKTETAEVRLMAEYVINVLSMAAWMADLLIVPPLPPGWECGKVRESWIAWRRRYWSRFRAGAGPREREIARLWRLIVAPLVRRDHSDDERAARTAIPRIRGHVRKQGGVPLLHIDPLHVLSELESEEESKVHPGVLRVTSDGRYVLEPDGIASALRSRWRAFAVPAAVEVVADRHAGITEAVLARGAVELVRQVRLLIEARAALPPRRKDDRTTPAAREFLCRVVRGEPILAAELASAHRIDPGNLARAIKRERGEVMRDPIIAALARDAGIGAA